MPISVFFIRGFTGYPDKNQHGYIRNDIGERISRISYHRAAMPPNTGDKLQSHQKDVECAAYNCYTKNFFFSFCVKETFEHEYLVYRLSVKQKRNE